MEKIVILNANNESMNVDVVRYFSEGTNKYFVFSLNETDGQGHMNIYVTKIMDQTGQIIGTNIIDDVEWTNLKTNLQRIIKENRANGNAIVNDLPYSNLVNVRVVDRRALKLLATSVDMLNLGYKVEQPISVETPSMPNPEPVQPTQPVQPTNDQMIFDAPFTQPVSQDVPVQPVQTEQNVVNQPISNPTVAAPADVNPIGNYEEMYLKEKENNARLVEENNNLKNQLNNYQTMITNIKNIISQ